jgi:hypothetical protein
VDDLRKKDVVLILASVISSLSVFLVCAYEVQQSLADYPHKSSHIEEPLTLGALYRPIFFSLTKTKKLKEGRKGIEESHHQIFDHSF